MKILAALTFLALASPALAQVNNPSIVPTPSSPAGQSCTSPLPVKLYTPSGALCTCQNGTVACGQPGGSPVGSRSLSCQPGLGDGLNALTAGTYLQTTCRNETGATWTITAIRCVTDSGSSTCNATNGSGTGLLSTAVTGTSTYANGTQSGTTTIASGDFLKITFVADGTTKQIGIDVAGTY